MRIPPKISAAIGIVVISMVAALAPSAVVRADDGMLPNAIVVNGRGYGHGRGMSQYGSYGWATTFGWSWQQILDFYYGGPTGNVIAPLSNPGQEMTVWLSAMNNAQTAVVADAGNAIFVQDPAPGRTWVSLVAREISQRVYRVWGSMERKCPTSTTDPGSEGFTVVADVATVASFTTTTGADPASAASTAIGLCEPRTNGRNKIRYYRGEIRAVNNTKGKPNHQCSADRNVFARRCATRIAGRMGCCRGRCRHERTSSTSSGGTLVFGNRKPLRGPCAHMRLAGLPGVRRRNVARVA